MAGSQAAARKLDPFRQPVAGLTDLIVVAAMFQSPSDPRNRINPHAVAYTVLFRKVKDDIREKNGMSLPSSAKKLFQDHQVLHPRFFAAAEQLEPIEPVAYDDSGRTKPAPKKSLEADAKRKNISHSEILSANMSAAGLPKPRGEVDAHHIVSVRSRYATRSRNLLYGWGIGIDDVDNGVFLPRNRRVKVMDRSLRQAAKHSVVHTRIYHVAVFFRLSQSHLDNGTAGREQLRGIKLDLLAGTFPYRPGDEL
ncbi:A nuclease of the HNH/ENDO VII superwith conserved AHH family protein [Burkholderia thailandensis MSMB121]|uniref:AHH domain-containing protein n=1 Tax=Burkholderia humptydooensis TaxID=430531 RepID=UPI000327F264|nr:AHH domain-containing protein [Burkholderia humptydooensis]AGK48859.1 A nuclease of the HNH/ENDO VII superwith conserved AHH family protein [Burkholderia thailandensis MSMB121]